mgnify:CR=1 FL=1
MTAGYRVVSVLPVAVSELTGDPLAALLESMRGYQREEGLSDKQMAAKLGIPRSTWTAAKNGSFRPGLEFVQKVAICAECRQLARTILLPASGVHSADGGR